jgi:hypothetical protein
LPRGVTFNLENCSASLENENGTVPGRVVNASGNLAYIYDACKNVCGPGIDGNDFTTVIQQMTLWFLPYLTLLAQVPFVTDNKFGDLIVDLLTLGISILTIYSLFVSLFN